MSSAARPSIRLPSWMAQRARDVLEGRKPPVEPRDAATVMLLRPLPGGAGPEAGGVSRSDRPAPMVPWFISASVSDRAMKMVAKMAVVRVSRLAVPRPDMKAPMPWELPIPSPPPSLRWISTTPINASVTNR